MIGTPARVAPTLGLLVCGALVALSAATESPAGGGSRPPFDPHKNPFSVAVRGLPSSYDVLGVYALPNEQLPIAVSDPEPARAFELVASRGEIERVGSREWRWTAPADVGACSLTVRSSAGGRSTTLNVFVMVPYKKLVRGYLNGYRIGEYPATPYRELDIYRPPVGFVEVTPELLDRRVSPHFRLRQFICKQAGGYPKYIVLRPKLLLKLEMLLERVNGLGYRCDTFNVMSGYRTPYYNHAIGNVKYSRHQWGGAADIFIDEDPKDGMMDDLDGDGRIDVRDARVMHEMIDALYGEGFYEPFIGGLGQYRKTASHGPFVHVDVRGFRARWGD